MTDSENDEIECPICFTKVKKSELQKLPCKHLLCHSCYDNWVNEGKNTCPFCRTKIKPNSHIRISRLLNDGFNPYSRNRYIDISDSLFIDNLQDDYDNISDDALEIHNNYDYYNAQPPIRSYQNSIESCMNYRRERVENERRNRRQPHTLPPDLQIYAQTLSQDILDLQYEMTQRQWIQFLRDNKSDTSNSNSNNYSNNRHLPEPHSPPHSSLSSNMFEPPPAPARPISRFRNEPFQIPIQEPPPPPPLQPQQQCNSLQFPPPLPFESHHRIIVEKKKTKTTSNKIYLESSDSSEVSSISFSDSDSEDDSKNKTGYRYGRRRRNRKNKLKIIKNKPLNISNNDKRKELPQYSKYELPSPFAPQQSSSSDQIIQPLPFAAQQSSSSDQFNIPAPFAAQQSSSSDQFNIPAPFAAQQSSSSDQFIQPPPFAPQQSLSSNQSIQPPPFTQSSSSDQFNIPPFAYPPPQRFIQPPPFTQSQTQETQSNQFIQPPPPQQQQQNHSFTAPQFPKFPIYQPYLPSFQSFQQIPPPATSHHQQIQIQHPQKLIEIKESNHTYADGEDQQISQPFKSILQHLNQNEKENSYYFDENKI